MTYMAGDGRLSNYTIFHRKIRGQPFGLYRWHRTPAPDIKGNNGFVARFGPVGHVQIQFYSGKSDGSAPRKVGRRVSRGVKLSWWGIRGRRGKRDIEIKIRL